MRNSFIIILLLVAIVGCNNDEPTEDIKYFLTDIVEKDGTAVKNLFENGRVIETSTKYKNTSEYVVTAEYLYNDLGKLTTLKLNQAAETYVYNENNELVESRYFEHGIVKRVIQYFHKSDGTLDYTVERASGDTVTALISEYKYEKGNPVEEAVYLHNNQDNTTTLLYTTLRKFDSKVNPYNTFNLDMTVPRKGNQIELWDADRPDDKWLTSYTYNDAGYPVSFEITSTYDDTHIEGEYFYDTQQ